MKLINETLNLYASVVNELARTLSGISDEHKERVEELIGKASEEGNRLHRKHFEEVFRGEGHVAELMKLNNAPEYLRGKNHFELTPDEYKGSLEKIVTLLTSRISNRQTGFQAGGQIKLDFDNFIDEGVLNSSNLYELKTGIYGNKESDDIRRLAIVYTDEHKGIHCLEFVFSVSERALIDFPNLDSYSYTEGQIFSTTYYDILDMRKVESELDKFLKETGVWVEPNEVGEELILQIVESNLGLYNKEPLEVKVGNVMVTLDLRSVVNEPIHTHYKVELLTETGERKLTTWSSLDPFVKDMVHSSICFELERIKYENSIERKSV